MTISAKDKSDNQKTISTKISIRKTTGIVTASELYIKENRNASSETVGNLYRDQSVTILAQQDEWYKVKKGSQIGYVLKKTYKKMNEQDVNHGVFFALFFYGIKTLQTHE
ncbi:SH3 domain-containing protein [Peribacillus frigoritolerans]|nr:SH3 domain-containing protein [Peribacillus frigoritolerans]